VPPVSLSLDWHGEFKFTNSAGSPAIELHSGTPGVSSPPQALAYAVMACMAMDVVHVIQKGRHDLRGLIVRFEGVRSEEHPRRFTSMDLHFDLTGVVPDHVVSRAIDLSRDKYCSVWNTIRPDVALTTRFTVHA
jgi:putative redox protein